MTTIFSVSDVTPNTDEARAVPIETTCAMRDMGRVECVQANARTVLTGTHPNGFLAAVHAAFADHRPLTLSPDDVWMCIAQGVSQHVALHAARFRPRLIDHAGRLELTVDRRSPPESDEDWREVAAGFVAQVRRHVGRRHDLLVADFSTTGAVERVASEVAMLSTFQHFFRFRFRTICGIPSITLRGAPEDWRSIRRRVAALAEFDLAWWTEPLDLILAHFEGASEGVVDRAFWQDFYNYRSMSGGSTFDGWVHAFFPYRKDPVEGVTVEAPVTVSSTPDGRARFTPRGSLKLASVPDGSVVAPAVWDRLGTTVPLRFHSGFAGCTMEDGAVRPVIGWWIEVGPPVERFFVTRAYAATDASAQQARSFASCGESLAGIAEALDVHRVTELVLSHEPLVSLDGIEALGSLESLTLDHCLALHDISALDRCLSLRSVSYFPGQGPLIQEDRYDWTAPSARRELAARLRAVVPHPDPSPDPRLPNARSAPPGPTPRGPRLYRGRWWLMRSSTPLECREDGLHFGRVSFGDDHASCAWWLVLRGPGVSAIATLPSVAKIACWEEIAGVVASDRPGVALYVASPSAAEVWFHDHPDVAALCLVAEGHHWDAIVAAGTLAFYVPLPPSSFESHLVATTIVR